jgi:hypothetical protein
MRANEFLTEKWSQKYKKSINCSNPKGFSQKAHCAGRKKNEEVEAPQPIKLRGFGASEKSKEGVANIKSKFYNEGPKSYIFWDKEGNLTIYEWKVPQNLPQVELHDLLLANARNFISEYEKIINEVH